MPEALIWKIGPMESLFSPTPILAALCTVIFLLYRAWPRAMNMEKCLEGYPKSSSTENTLAVSKESDFPEHLLTGKDIFKLEQRAIFSKSWLYLSHRSRFTKAGDYHSFEVAGFPIFLILGQDGEVRAFHNVCRHRAYTITRKECGSSTVLGCRYHGWSYDTKGQLVKAPHFDDVPGFYRKQNGLFAIRVFQSAAGFIFVSLAIDGSDEMQGSNALDEFAGRQGFVAQSRWVEGKTLEGSFNWKMAVHLRQPFGPACFESKLVPTAQTSIFARMKEYLFGVCADDSDLLLFPNASFHIFKGTRHWYSLSFHPASEQKTLVRYDLYGSRSTDSKSTSQEVSRQLHEAMSKDNSNNTVEPKKEILQRLKSHSELERMERREIHPAMKRSITTAKFLQGEQRKSNAYIEIYLMVNAHAVTVCRELECPSDALKDLAW
ncbi:putative iron-sulfur cluster-binding protein [Aspergillus clavatus NRRL 1]|uniref:Iron-sulfur cluster-binding protein, putative n=1 Tax=Aspergillus clavatus (strain ATCC 1007 / CBS 513.65 / DSM 816 / NCTC 3887 / NRRL 1 / QM 1276 / 107) TaxID=344612 RepID=A1CME8_ASPCL|nr:iron-sulfur cluster-binding protein, putative [Aspergillus clavatus NRRL 1]EAW08735.1 iron-sulfur cluster-binding protein, putative [Aspergillus clavatus NRRL 1]